MNSISLITPFQYGYDTAKRGVLNLYHLFQELVLTPLSERVIRTLLNNYEWIHSPSYAGQIKRYAYRFFTKNMTKTESFEKLLPPLPVPDLDDTLQKFLKSVKPLLTDAEFLETKRKAEEFQKNEGPLLQATLKAYASTKQNWLESWWEEWAYLRSRYPLITSTDWYGIDRVDSFESSYKNPQIDRIARITHLLLQYHKKIEEEALPPNLVKGTIPLSMHPFTRVFGVVRTPGLEKDSIDVYRDSKHILVLANHQIYKMNVIHNDMTPASESELKQQFEWIKRDADRAEGIPVSILTTLDRPSWFADRKHLENISGENRQKLSDCERALFTVRLSDKSPSTPQEIAEALFKERFNGWFDKGVLITSFLNGKSGGVVEHSFADATTVSQIQNWVYSQEEKVEDNKPASDKVNPPEKILFQLDNYLRNRIDLADQQMDESMKDLNLKVLEFHTFGSDFIKNQRISPDSLIQMMIQWTYYKMYREAVFTYETAATSLFYHGRTETIRSACPESKEMCQLLENKNSSVKEKLESIRQAVAAHVKIRTEASLGLGCDRHLMGLRLISQGADIPFFKDKATNLPMKLATSQTPSEYSGGGGFYPVVEDGYGVSYTLWKEHIHFHITSFHHIPQNDSKLFAETLEESLKEFKQLAETEFVG